MGHSQESRSEITSSIVIGTNSGEVKVVSVINLEMVDEEDSSLETEQQL